jgi:hypothetical protein
MKLTNDEIMQIVIDTVYDTYELENDMDHMRYIHPMFYNGTFSENNEYQPPKPEPLMSKEEFEKYLNKGNTEWDNAIQVLTIYIMRQNEII